MEFNLQNGMFTLLSASIHEIDRDLKTASVLYKIEANGAAGKLISNERLKMRGARIKNTLHGYVTRNDRKVFEFFYNFDTEDFTCKKI